MLMGIFFLIRFIFFWSFTLAKGSELSTTKQMRVWRNLPLASANVALAKKKCDGPRTTNQLRIHDSFFGAPHSNPFFVHQQFGERSVLSKSTRDLSQKLLDPSPFSYWPKEMFRVATLKSTTGPWKKNRAPRENWFVFTQKLKKSNWDPSKILAPHQIWVPTHNWFWQRFIVISEMVGITSALPSTPQRCI